MEVVQLIVLRRDNGIQILPLDINDKYVKGDDEEILEIVLSVKGSITEQLLKNKYKINEL